MALERLTKRAETVLKVKSKTFLKKEKPERANIAWRDVEALFNALGAEITEGRSRVRVALKDVRAVFHRPHPRKETNKGTVKSVRRFLEAAGVKP